VGTLAFPGLGKGIVIGSRFQESNPVAFLNVGPTTNAVIGNPVNPGTGKQPGPPQFMAPTLPFDQTKPPSSAPAEKS
jgi:hypothetical protein